MIKIKNTKAVNEEKTVISILYIQLKDSKPSKPF